MGITSVFLNECTGLLGGVGSKTAFGYVAVGEGSTAFAEGQTTLVTEITTSGLERAAVTPTQATTTHTNDTLQFVKAFSVTGTKTVTEAAILNAASTGTMAARTVLTTPRSVINGDTYTLTYKIIAAH
jgi:hypothetical protein